MPLEPKQNIEEELKAYAKERRERANALSEMPLVTRRQLQREVEQTLSKPRSETRWQIFQSLWPRLAFAGIIAVIFVGVLYWQGYFHAEKTLVVADNNQQDRLGESVEKMPSQNKVSHENDQLKKNQSDELQKNQAEHPATVAIKESETPPASAAVATRQSTETKGYGGEGAPLNAGRGSGGEFSGERARRLEGHAHTEPDTVGNTTSVGGTGVALTREKIAFAEKKVAETPSAQVTASSPKDESQSIPVMALNQNAAPVATAQTPLNNQASNVQNLSNNNWNQVSRNQLSLQFVRVDNRNQYRANLLSPALPRVMTSFVMERHGNSIRVFDGDGSVYEGSTVEQADASRNQAQNMVNVRTVAGGQGLAFRVSGLNRTRKQQIVFEGTLSCEAVANSSMALNQSPAQNTQSAVNLQNVNQTQNNSFNDVTFSINGRMKVGDNIEFVMDAKSLH